MRLYRAEREKKGKVYSTFTLAYTASGTRQRRTFSTEGAARDAAKQIAEQLSEGIGHALSLNPSEAADAIAALKMLRRHPGTTLAAAVSQWHEAVEQLEGKATLSTAASMCRQRLEDHKTVEITAPLLVSKFIETKNREDLSSYYLTDLERKLTRFADAFRCSISSIRAEDLSAWLDKQGGSTRNANNLRNSLVTLFSFARTRGHLPRELKTEAELVTRKKERPSLIGIYTPEEIASILRKAPERLRPSIAIAAFAGLRSAEIFRLDWADVKVDRRLIDLSAEKAKTATRRLVPITDNLAAWLKPFVEDGAAGRVCPDYANLDNLTRHFAAIATAAGFPAKRNAFRHSYASYRLAIVESADKVALEMGNSPRKLFTNYRELVTQEEARDWFAVMPTKPSRKRSTGRSRRRKTRAVTSRHAA